MSDQIDTECWVRGWSYDAMNARMRVLLHNGAFLVSNLMLGSNLGPRRQDMDSRAPFLSVSGRTVDNPHSNAMEARVDPLPSSTTHLVANNSTTAGLEPLDYLDVNVGSHACSLHLVYPVLMLPWSRHCTLWTYILPCSPLLTMCPFIGYDAQAQRLDKKCAEAGYQPEPSAITPGP